MPSGLEQTSSKQKTTLKRIYTPGILLLILISQGHSDYSYTLGILVQNKHVLYMNHTKWELILMGYYYIYPLGIPIYLYPRDTEVSSGSKRACIEDSSETIYQVISYYSVYL